MIRLPQSHWGVRSVSLRSDAGPPALFNRTDSAGLAVRRSLELSLSSLGRTAEWLVWQQSLALIRCYSCMESAGCASLMTGGTTLLDGRVGGRCVVLPCEDVGTACSAPVGRPWRLGGADGGA